MEVRKKESDGNDCIMWRGKLGEFSHVVGNRHVSESGLALTPRQLVRVRARPVCTLTSQ